jgi:hypothetical protein
VVIGPPAFIFTVFLNAPVYAFAQILAFVTSNTLMFGLLLYYREKTRHRWINEEAEKWLASPSLRRDTGISMAKTDTARNAVGSHSRRAGGVFIFPGSLLTIGVTSLFLTQDRALSGFPCLVGAFLLYCGFALRRYFRKRYRTDQRFKHDITADISEDGVHVVTAFEESQLKWNAIVRFLESDKIFMFFYSDMIFSVVPKRAFAPSEIDHFVTYCTARF